jgi:hypothetical protein
MYFFLPFQEIFAAPIINHTDLTSSMFDNFKLCIFLLHDGIVLLLSFIYFYIFLQTVPPV